MVCFKKLKRARNASGYNFLFGFTHHPIRMEGTSTAMSVLQPFSSFLYPFIIQSMGSRDHCPMLGNVLCWVMCPPFGFVVMTRTRQCTPGVCKS